MSRGRLALTLMAAFAATATITPAEVTAARDGPPVVLTATTEISATATASARVVVPATASIALSLRGMNPDVVVRGGDRFAAVGLVPAGGGDFALLSGVIRACNSPGCTGRPTHFTLGWKTRRGRAVIPPGSYRLVAIADDGPIDVTLRLRELEGRKSVVLPERARAIVGRPQAWVSTGPAGNVYSAGRTDDVAGTGLAFSALWLGGVPGAQTDLGTCIYRGGPPVPEAAAYNPACYELGADGFRYGAVATATGFRVEVLSLSRPLERGTWSHGLYYECACAAEIHDSFSAWIELDP